jgi:hypothetical protein
LALSETVSSLNTVSTPCEDLRNTSSPISILSSIKDLRQTRLIHPAGYMMSLNEESVYCAPLRTPEDEAKAVLNQSILDEVRGHIHYAVGGFFEKYFENRSWSPLIEQLFRTSAHKVFPHLAFKAVWDTPSGSHGGHSVFRTSPAPPNTSHFFLVPNESACTHGKYSWADVQVVGQIQENPDDDYLRGFLRLYGHAREVFLSQPTRLFLHGFYVFGSIVELWMFGRSGLYSSEPFDIDADRSRFITTIAGYQVMSDSELGINTLIEKDKAGKYILFQGDDESQPCRLYLEDKPIVYPRTIVSRGPACYRARRPASVDWELVLKLSWRSGYQDQEGEILRLIRKRKVWGVGATLWPSTVQHHFEPPARPAVRRSPKASSSDQCSKSGTDY